MHGGLRTLQIGMTASLSRAGGVDRYFFDLVRALAEGGTIVRGLLAGAAPSPNATDDGAFEADRDLLPIKWLKIRRAAGPLLRDSDVVVSHFAPYVFPLLPKLAGKPLVVHFHGPWALEGRYEGRGRAITFAKRQIELAVYRAASRVIVLSDAFADIATRHYDIPERIIRVIPGGVDLARFHSSLSKPQARERLGWSAGRPTVVSVRRLVESKGIDNLIKAAATLRETIPGVFIAIGGTGPMAAEYERSIETLGLAGTVRMIGKIPDEDLATVYRAADLAVVPSKALEGFGLVVVEALACGTPALVTPVGGLPEVVRALDPALILRSSEPGDLAAGIGAALSGAASLPNAATCIAYSHSFRWSEIARRVRDVYLEAARTSLAEPAASPQQPASKTGSAEFTYF